MTCSNVCKDCKYAQITIIYKCPYYNKLFELVERTCNLNCKDCYECYGHAIKYICNHPDKEK